MGRERQSFSARRRARELNGACAHYYCSRLPVILRAPQVDGAYNADDYKHLQVSAEIKKLFEYIPQYKPHEVELDTTLKVSGARPHPPCPCLSFHKAQTTTMHDKASSTEAYLLSMNTP